MLNASNGKAVQVSWGNPFATLKVDHIKEMWAFES